jgi:hypothetical protein
MSCRYKFTDTPRLMRYLCFPLNKFYSVAFFMKVNCPLEFKPTFTASLSIIQVTQEVK